jgi:uncharacterized protein
VSETLPLFPLGTTLLPGQLLPLHVFEPRYRDLVRDLVQGSFDPGTGRSNRRGPRFGVVTIRVGWEVGAATVPDLHAIGCAAEVLEVQQHSDGTSDLVAVGRERFQLLGLDATAGTSYLTGRVRWLDEPPGSASPGLVSDVQALFGKYRSIVTIAGQGPFETRRDEEPETGEPADVGDEEGSPGGRRIPSDPTVLSWLVAGSMVLHAGERQRLLEDVDAAARLRRLRGLLRRELTLLPVLPSLPTSDLARQPPDPR